MKKENRINYIDTAKCFAIMTVILGHILIFYEKLGTGDHKLLMFIYTFHMPSFFIFSGILFNDRKWFKTTPQKFIFSKIKTLLIPYLFLDILGGITKFLINKKFSIKCIKKVIVMTLTLKTNIGPNWFLPAMLIASIIFYFFEKYKKPFFKYFILIPIIIIFKI